MKTNNFNGMQLNAIADAFARLDNAGELSKYLIKLAEHLKACKCGTREQRVLSYNDLISDAPERGTLYTLASVLNELDKANIINDAAASAALSTREFVRAIVRKHVKNLQ